MGSNKILIVDEDFRNVEVRTAGDIKETHGFSSFKVCLSCMIDLGEQRRVSM